MKKGRLSKRIAAYFMTGLAGAALAFSPIQTPVASAGVEQLIVGGLNAISQAAAVRESIEIEGSTPSVQDYTLKKAVSSYGEGILDTDEEHNRRVTEVMNRLIGKGEYAMDNNCLPFRWRVVANEELNASCYYTNAVVVYSGILDELKDDNMLAGVLSHEMIHGLYHHCAKENAERMIYAFGGALLQSNLSNEQMMDLSDYLINYATVKNTTYPNEKEADEEGFYLMTSAGYNPAGLTTGFRRMLSRGDYDPGFIVEFFGAPGNHPSLKKRVEYTEKIMEAYGYNHVKVKNGNEVYVDDVLLLAADATPEHEDWENAYLIAGGLCKAFHDNRFSTSWNITQNSLLNSDPVYKELKAAVRDKQLYAILDKMVTDAYNADRASGSRSKADEADYERRQKIKEDKVKYADKKYAQDYLRHWSGYRKLGLYNLAFTEAERMYNAAPDTYWAPWNMAVACAELARDKKEKTGYEDITLYQRAVELDKKAMKLTPADEIKNLYGNMAIHYSRLNQMTEAKSYANQALEMGCKDENCFRVLGQAAYTEGDKSSALAYYKRYLDNGGTEDAVPQDMMEELTQAQLAAQAEAEQSKKAVDAIYAGVE